MADAEPQMNAASTGAVGTAAAFLDVHFEACREPYEAMLRSVGLEVGWHVLDAGCGSGSFLPLMAELIGPTGRLAAIDLASDNVVVVEARAAHLGCPVVARTGSLTALPYPDGTFDAVWCSNALMYLSDEEMAAALAQFRRVVKPGGVVAVKDIDLGFSVLHPADPAVLWHLLDTGRRRIPVVHGCLRPRELRRWFVRAGLLGVGQQVTLIELGPPLKAMQRQYITSQLAQLGSLAAEAGVPEDDLAFWRGQCDPQSPHHLGNHPDLYWSEGHYVVTGQVPDSSMSQA
jgi:SAM-dependent methyltransferase